MNAPACHFCRASSANLQRTPTLLGACLLCRRCRERYRTAVIAAVAEFHRRQQAPAVAAPTREAA